MNSALDWLKKSPVSHWLKNHTAAAVLVVGLGLLSAIASANFFGIVPATLRLGRPGWLLLTLFCATVWVATRTWRHKEAAMRPRLLRQQVLLKTLAFAATVVCALNLAPKRYWQALDGMVFDSFSLSRLEQKNEMHAAELANHQLLACLRLGRTASPGADTDQLPGGLECQMLAANKPRNGFSAGGELGKDIQESIERWGTLFAWLLAVAAIVITAITGWVVGLLKEARDSLAAVKNEQNLNAQHMGMQLDLDTTKSQLRIAQLLYVLDKDVAPNWRKILLHCRKLVVDVEDLHDATVDCAETARKFEIVLASLSSGSQTLEPDRRCRQLSRELLAPCLTSHLDVLRHEPHLQGADGQRALFAVAGIVRVLRAL